MSRRAGFLALNAAVAVLAGCAAAPADPTQSGGGTRDEPQRYAAVAMVLESPEHDPQLCLGGVLESLPPQCGGPDVVGWDWAAVEDEESMNGTTWGTWRVVGTWDGEALTLTEPPAQPPLQRLPGEDMGEHFATPCPTPDGGWPVEEPSTATEEGFAAATAYAEAQPEVGGVWVDAQAELAPPRPDLAQPAVLNVTFVSDLARHERELRARYGGPLCVSAAERTKAALQRLQGELQEALGDAVLSTGEDVVDGTVSVDVVVADEEVLARVRALDPDGIVRVHGALEPVG
jgi:hypothetical protein